MRSASLYLILYNGVVRIVHSMQKELLETVQKAEAPALEFCSQPSDFECSSEITKRKEPQT